MLYTLSSLGLLGTVVNIALFCQRQIIVRKDPANQESSIPENTIPENYTERVPETEVLCPEYEIVNSSKNGNQSTLKQDSKEENELKITSTRIQIENEGQAGFDKWQATTNEERMMLDGGRNMPRVGDITPGRGAIPKPASVTFDESKALTGERQAILGRGQTTINQVLDVEGNKEAGPRSDQRVPDTGETVRDK